MGRIPENAKKVFSGVLHDVYQWDQEQFDGTFRTFEGLKRRDAVTVLAITEDHKIIINYEEQPGVPGFISMPGGNSESQNYLEDAKRELLEETGFGSDEWSEWFVSDILYYEKMDWNNHFFIAKNCKEIKLPDNDPGEKIELRFIDFDEFVQITQDSKFRNSEIRRMVAKIINNPDALENLRKKILD